MCIRDRFKSGPRHLFPGGGSSNGRTADFGSVNRGSNPCPPCLLYTSDAADERSSVDLGGRRIIKKKKIMERMERGITTKRTKKAVVTKNDNEK